MPTNLPYALGLNFSLVKQDKSFTRSKLDPDRHQTLVCAFSIALPSWAIRFGLV
jgi:hypothetical protein